MSGKEIQRAYEAEGGLPGKVAALGLVWRDIAVSCKCGTAASDLVADEPGCDLKFYQAINALRADYKKCPDCGQNYRIGLGKRG